MNNSNYFAPEYLIEEIYQDIIHSVSENIITFISSSTGTGKSTQVPQYLFQYMQQKQPNTPFCIICTEPRSIACDSISQYITSKNPEIKIKKNDARYYFNFKESNESELIFLKESDLLRILSREPNLNNCDILIIDEVHERTMKLELLLYFLKHFTLKNKNKDNLNRNKNIKIVFMSATLNIDDIYKYFSDVMKNNSNNAFGVVKQNNLNNKLQDSSNYDIIYNTYYNPSLSTNNKFQDYNMGKVLREISKIIRYEIYINSYIKKTILVFLPDFNSIYNLQNMLNKEHKDNVNIYQFSSNLSKFEQKDLLEELRNDFSNKSNIILATNLAETCLTFPNCDIVIDCGLKKNIKYNYDANIYEELIEYISQDSCIQRSGRCGRGRKRGVCYRLFSEEMFNLLPKFRNPDIENKNIDLIILKLFDCDINISQYFLEQIQKNKFLDFLTKVPKEKIDKIIEKLISYKAIENNKSTKFGKWIIKSNMDIELGYYFNNFKEKNFELLCDETIFQLMNIISTSDGYNNCELFYTDVDPDFFKLRLLDYRKQSEKTKTATELSKLISKNIINKVVFGNEIKNDYLYGINYVSPYYKLFSMLDKIYNAKNFYTINKVFQLGEWMISLFFIRQYKLIKCLFHNSNRNNEDENYKDNEGKCSGCKISKYFYCSVYSLNEKYFQSLKNKISRIKSILKLKEMSNNQLTTSNEEYLIAKWNIIYLNLISKKPDIYLRENFIYKYLSEIEEINFDEILTTIYNEYKKVYIESATKFLELTKNDDEMIIQSKSFKTEEESITLYFNILGKVNMVKNYFFEFLPKDVNNYFCFVKFRKIFTSNGGEKKLSQLFFKNINPIFDEMKLKSGKINKHIELLEESVEEKEMKSYNNIGKYFYIRYISPKLKIKNIERYHNSIIYVYNRSEKDYNKEQQIQDLIDIEKGNYDNMLDFIQCLKSGCITMQLSQGLNIKKIFDTYRQNNQNNTELVYEIKPTETDPSKDIKYYYDQITNNPSFHYENIFIQEDHLIIIFKDTLKFSLFSERQNLGIKLCPYKDSDITNINTNNIYTNNANRINENNNINETNNENFSANNKNNMKIYYVSFDKKNSLEFINKTMSNYLRKMRNKYNCKINYVIDEENENNSIMVYYYIVSVNQLILNKKDLIGKESKDSSNNIQNFVIDSLSFSSDYDYFRKFKKFCLDNHLNVVPCYNSKKDKNKYFMREYKLINYSTENMKLIQNYIGCTIIRLNSFAIMELKLKSKDTFLAGYKNIFTFARSMNCNISFIYYECKVKIYGEPENRMKLSEIITDYFSELQKEKITFTLKEQKGKLIIKSLLKKAASKQITIIPSEGESGTRQLEFRKKYFDYISNLFKKEKRLKNIKNKTITCAICLEKFDNKYNNNYFKLKLCGHKFCLECLKMQICNSLSSPNNIPIKCIKCQNIIANSDIFELFIPGTEEYDFVINKLINLFMIKNLNTNIQKKYFWCPNKKENCNYIFNSASLKEQGEVLLKCPNCNCKICLICNGLIKEGKQHNLECQNKLYSTLGDKNREWFIENSKDCPICHTVYEKNKGCNHMTCEMCKPPTHFCYICGSILDNKNPLSHFSEEGTKCYNRLWDDISANERINFYKKINKTEIKEKNMETKNDSRNQNKKNISMRENGNNRHNYDDLNCTMIMIDKVKNRKKEGNYRNHSREKSRLGSLSREFRNSNLRNMANRGRNRSFAKNNNSYFRRNNGFDN